MSNGYLVKFLAQENGISIEEAEKVCEERKKFRRYFKDEEKKYKSIPINPDKFDEILIRVGRKKFNEEVKEIENLKFKE